MAKDDPTAVVEIVAQAPGHIMLHSAGRVLLRNDENAPVSFTAAPSKDDSKKELSHAITDHVNRACARQRTSPRSKARQNKPE